MFAVGKTVGRLPRQSHVPIRPLRMLVAMCAVLAVAGALTGCGEDVPDSAVATVDGEPVERQSFDHWLAVAAKSSGRPNAAVPKPPDYANCVKQKQGETPKSGQAKPNEAQLRTQCKAEYEALRNQVLQLLVSMQWIEGEANDRGISVDDAEVRKAFEEQKKRSFPSESDFERFLKDSGQTEQDVLTRVRFDLLSSKIRDQVTKGKDQVTDNQISTYYRQNRQRFAQPERRDLRLVLTKSRGDAEDAMAQLRAGRSWSTVAKNYSIDEATKAKGGTLEDVARGQYEKALDQAIFRAPKALVRGPVATKFGYYVFAVTDVEAPSRQTFEQAKPTIEQLLAAERRQKALEGFIESFREKWRERTECRDGFETPDCKNGPKATATPTQPTTDGRDG
jgi:foldase protein PrsA